MSKRETINIIIEGVPIQHRTQIIERLKLSIKAIMEEYGAEGISTKEEGK